jgi:hypothetical protein
MYSVFNLACANATGDEIKLNDVWDLVEGIRTVKTDKMSVQKLFGSDFDKVSEYDFGTKYFGRGPNLSDGLQITEFSILAYRNGQDPTVGAYLSGRCVTAREAEEVYPGLAMFGASSHGDPNAVFFYLLANGKRELQFFFNFHTGCLVSIKSEESRRVKPPAVNATSALGQ